MRHGRMVRAGLAALALTVGAAGSGAGCGGADLKTRADPGPRLRVERAARSGRAPPARREEADLCADPDALDGLDDPCWVDEPPEAVARALARARRPRAAETRRRSPPRTVP
jgi:hypothetical protein